MGISESLANEFQVIKEFNDFVSYTNNIDRQYLTNFGEVFTNLKTQVEAFFKQYKGLVNEKKIEGVDLNRYFPKILIALGSFKDCATCLKTQVKRSDLNHFLNNFKADLRDFLKFISYMLKICGQILNQISTDADKSLILQFCLELSIFNFSINIQNINKPPRYTMSILPAYELLHRVQNEESRYISVTLPHNSGKSTLIPLQLCSRILSKQKESHLIVVIEHDRSIIRSLKMAYEKIISFATAGMNQKKDDDDDDDDKPITVTSSLSEIRTVVGYGQLNSPCIAILSPHDALSLVHSVSDIKEFVKQTIFVFDDINLRTVETDVLIQDIKFTKVRCSFDDIRIVLVSAVTDLNLMYFLGCRTTISIQNVRTTNVRRKEIRSKSISELENKSLFNEMRKFFNTWLEKDDAIQKVPIGSVIMFVPSEKVGQRIYRQIFKHYTNDNSQACVCPLRSTIKRGEKIDDYYARLIGEMKVVLDERPGSTPLFLLPINLNNNFVTNEERTLIRSKLIPYFKEHNLVRVIITTIKNESILQLNDLRAIFDSGIEEVEFYDEKQSIYHLREQLLPKMFLEEHEKLLDRCGESIYYSFDVENSERPDKLIPYVRRGELGRELLLLRNLNIKLEKQLNLPNEPNGEILEESIRVLKKIGIIDETSDNNLTTIGSVAAKFAAVSPFFALATAKFNQNQQFAFLCSLLIENSRTLVINQNSELLTKNFNRESDVVTLLDSIYEVIKKSENGDQSLIEKSGLSIGCVNSIFSIIDDTFEGVNGRTLIINSVNWARSQPGGTLAMVDKFVSLLDESEFLSKRKTEFKFVVGAGQSSESVLVYKANDLFAFKSDEGETANRPSEIRFARRPGWIGLQSPGQVYALSVIADDQLGLNRGLIIHHVQSSSKPGVVSMEVDNPSLNSVFFVSLFDAYWSDRPTSNDFIGIYHSSTANKESSSLICMTENHGKACINYCPKSNDVEAMMKEAIPKIGSLMPFVPRSIISKVDDPLCAIEIIGYGTSSNYVYNVHIIDDKDDERSLPFKIDRKSIDFCLSHIDLLNKESPQIRFAITGESFYYKNIRGRQVDADLANPDVYKDIGCVFDDIHSSHLFLIVDKELNMGGDLTPLQWLPQPDARPAEFDESENEMNEVMLNVASKIMNGTGAAERSADFFFVMINNGFPTPGVGEVPESMRARVGYEEGEGKAIKGGINSLIRHFLNVFTKKQKVTDKIPLISLSSTNSWPDSPTRENTRLTLCEEISRNIKSHFRLTKENDEVQAMFLGPSMIAVRVTGLGRDLVSHKRKLDVWDDSYQPCRADSDITNVVKDTIHAPVSQVVHVPTVNITVWNMVRYKADGAKFVETVRSVADKFGFLVSALADYKEGITSNEQRQLGIVGDIEVEFLGLPTGIAFATSIKKLIDIEFSRGDITLTNTMTTACLAREMVNPELGPAPQITANNRVFKIDPSEIVALSEMVARMSRSKRKRYKINADYNVLIVPMTEDTEAMKMIREVRDKENDTTCLYACEMTEDYLSQSLYMFNKDGSVKALAVCRQCMLQYFRDLEAFQLVLDPNTKAINYRMLPKLEIIPKCFPFPSNEQDGDTYWPQIPLGQAVMTLLSDSDLIGPYVKSWFTIVIDFIVRKENNFLTRCPDHPDITYKTPKRGHNVKCPHCDLFFCGSCMRWHKMSDSCDSIPDDGAKRCPNCKCAFHKISGCNHITCKCGKHWCYKCDVSQIYNSASDCMKHMREVHKSIND